MKGFIYIKSYKCFIFYIYLFGFARALFRHVESLVVVC